MRDQSIDLFPERIQLTTNTYHLSFPSCEEEQIQLLDDVL